MNNIYTIIILIILSLLEISQLFSQRMVHQLDARLGYGILNRPYLDFGVYVDKDHRHRLGVEGDYVFRLRKDFKVDDYLDKNSFLPYLFTKGWAFQGPGAALKYDFHLPFRFISLGPKLSFSHLWAKNFTQDPVTNATHNYSSSGNMYGISFQTTIGIDRKGIVSGYGEIGYVHFRGKAHSLKREFVYDPLNPGWQTSENNGKFVHNGFLLQLGIAVKIAGFNAGMGHR